MNKNFQIDSLDKKILSILSKDARIPFLEVARLCNVTGSAIHQRVQKLREEGVISGSKFIIEPKGLGYTTCAYLGVQVNLTSVRSHDYVFEQIVKIPEVVECHHISGKYSLLLKVYTKSNEHLKNIIVEKIQSIIEVVSTETFISLQEGFTRDLPNE
ncbi:MAG: Lrp/AsnC ligand binding domain-containing protein [Bacteroidales bacterium]|nr:Lrp/AsnC ligand binding domain-containing protein [Bacteroidales bacterium]